MQYEHISTAECHSSRPSCNLFIIFPIVMSRINVFQCAERFLAGVYNILQVSHNLQTHCGTL